MLLAVTERTTVGNHTATQYIVFIGNNKKETHSRATSCFYRELLFLRTDHLFRHRVKKNKANRSGNILSGKVCHRSGYRSFISHADETRQVRSQHKVLTGHSSSIDHTCHHSFGMRISPEIPTGKALRHGERERNFPLFIGTKLRIEESGLGKIGTQFFGSLRKGFSRSGIPVGISRFGIFNIGFIADDDRHTRLGFRHSAYLCASNNRCVLSIITKGYHFLFENQITDVIEWKHEVVVCHRIYLQALGREPIIIRVHSPITIHPACSGHRKVVSDSQTLIIFPYLIQRSVIHGSQHFSCGRHSLRGFDSQLPLFFLSRTQFITEYLPFHCQCFIRQAFRHSYRLLIYGTILHKAESSGKPVAIRFFIRIFKTLN